MLHLSVLGITKNFFINLPEQYTFHKASKLTKLAEYYNLWNWKSNPYKWVLHPFYKENQNNNNLQKYLEMP